MPGAKRVAAEASKSAGLFHLPKPMGFRLIRIFHRRRRNEPRALGQEVAGGFCARLRPA
jgi:hypothetical protein